MRPLNAVKSNYNNLLTADEVSIHSLQKRQFIRNISCPSLTYRNILCLDIWTFEFECGFCQLLDTF